MKDPEQCTGRRILIVDDQNSIHEVFRSVLLPSSLNHCALNDLESELFGDTTLSFDQKMQDKSVSNIVEFAHQGEEGFLKLRTALERGEHFDLAFVDMQMPPGWNGIETIRQLWTLSPTLPVVVCTAYSEYSWMDVCRLLGNADQLNLLPKPFVAAEIHGILNNLPGSCRQSGQHLVF